MLLKSINYSEYKGTEQEWTLEGLTLGNRNLLVGKNATGKTRALSVIYGLARLLRGEQSPDKFRSGDNTAVFSEDGKTIE